MLTIIGAMLVLSGLILLVYNHIRDPWIVQGISLVCLNGTLIVVGRHIGQNLETKQGREQFVRDCRELIRKGDLPHSLELEKQIFVPQDILWEEFETTRRAAVAMWIIIEGTDCELYQAEIRESLSELYRAEIRESLYDLYRANRKSTDGLETLLGPRKPLQ